MWCGDLIAYIIGLHPFKYLKGYCKIGIKLAFCSEKYVVVAKSFWVYIQLALAVIHCLCLYQEICTFMFML